MSAIGSDLFASVPSEDATDDFRAITHAHVQTLDVRPDRALGGAYLAVAPAEPVRRARGTSVISAAVLSSLQLQFFAKFGLFFLLTGRADPNTPFPIPTPAARRISCWS